MFLATTNEARDRVAADMDSINPGKNDTPEFDKQQQTTIVVITNNKKGHIMATKHYYAMHTPYGNAVDTHNTPIGTVVVFDTKRERNDWVYDHSYSTRTGEAHQTRTITEHEARVIMLRQQGRAMLEHQNRSGITWQYREYAQYCPTAVMARDYTAAIGADD